MKRLLGVSELDEFTCSCGEGGCTDEALHLMCGSHPGGPAFTIYRKKDKTLELICSECRKTFCFLALDESMKKISAEIDRGKDNYCSDCGADEGELHRFICNYELCPFCGHQYKSCDCKKAGLLLDDFETEEELRSGKKRRVPHIIYPNLCARCGALWPKLFMVPDEEWERYIRINKRDKVICRPCFDYIKRLIDKGTRKVED